MKYTCNVCRKPADNLMIIQFSDAEARAGKLNPQPYLAERDGILNRIEGCGTISCWALAMSRRKQNCENQETQTSK